MKSTTSAYQRVMDKIKYKDEKKKMNNKTIAIIYTSNDGETRIDIDKKANQIELVGFLDICVKLLKKQLSNEMKLTKNIDLQSIQ